MRKQDIKTKVNSSTNEISLRERFFKLFRDCPIPDNELLPNLGLFIKRQDLTSILFMNELYKKIINVHGIVVEFGVRWGQNLSLFESFRGIYEPFITIIVRLLDLILLKDFLQWIRRMANQRSLRLVLTQQLKDMKII